MKKIYERIRYIRKNHLKVSQESFGKMLGVSRDVIKNIELNTLARPEQKKPLIKLICHEFNVDYHWLTTGQGKMFVETDTNYISLIDKITADNNQHAKNILKSLNEFSIEDWEKLEKIIDLVFDTNNKIKKPND